MPAVLTIGVAEATSGTVNTDRPRSLGEEPGEQATGPFRQTCRGAIDHIDYGDEK